MKQVGIRCFLCNNNNVMELFTRQSVFTAVKIVADSRQQKLVSDVILQSETLSAGTLERSLCSSTVNLLLRITFVRIHLNHFFHSAIVDTCNSAIQMLGHQFQAIPFEFIGFLTSSLTNSQFIGNQYDFLTLWSSDEASRLI